MVDMIVSMRAYEASQRVLHAIDDTLGKAVTLRWIGHGREHPKDGVSPDDYRGHRRTAGEKAGLQFAEAGGARRRRAPHPLSH